VLFHSFQSDLQSLTQDNIDRGARMFSVDRLNIWMWLAAAATQRDTRQLRRTRNISREKLEVSHLKLNCRD